MPQTALRAEISLEEGRYTQPPNVVLVPRDRKTIPVTIVWTMTSDDTYVVSTPNHKEGHEWSLLDDHLRQVQHGHGHRAVRTPKACLDHVSRTLHGGGPENPREMEIELSTAKLRNGHTYTLISRHFGVLAVLEIVVVHLPKAKAKAKPKTKKTGAKSKGTTKRPRRRPKPEVAKKTRAA